MSIGGCDALVMRSLVTILQTRVMRCSWFLVTIFSARWPITSQHPPPPRRPSRGIHSRIRSSELPLVDSSQGKTDNYFYKKYPLCHTYTYVWLGISLEHIRQVHHGRGREEMMGESAVQATEIHGHGVSRYWQWQTEKIGTLLRPFKIIPWERWFRSRSIAPPRPLERSFSLHQSFPALRRKQFLRLSSSLLPNQSTGDAHRRTLYPFQAISWTTKSTCQDFSGLICILFAEAFQMEKIL